MTPKRMSTIKRRARMSAAIDALAAAVPGGALMAATDPADFLLAVRCHIAAAETRIAALEAVAAVALEVRDCAGMHGCRVSGSLLMALGAALSRLDGTEEVVDGR